MLEREDPGFTFTITDGVNDKVLAGPPKRNRKTDA